jgi:mono/diheme cytochrome c family protein
MRPHIATLALLLGAAACGGAADSDDGDDDRSERAAAAETVSWESSAITPQMVALGDSLFHGLIGATSCQACHGADGKQATVAPDLTDAEWLHSDGSWEGIHTTIKSGVMSPKQFQSIMPPFGGAPLTLPQSRAVAAYVYKLAHP